MHPKRCKPLYQWMQIYIRGKRNELREKERFYIRDNMEEVVRWGYMHYRQSSRRWIFHSWFYVYIDKRRRKSEIWSNDNKYFNGIRNE